MLHNCTYLWRCEDSPPSFDCQPALWQLEMSTTILKWHFVSKKNSFHGIRARYFHTRCGKGLKHPRSALWSIYIYTKISFRLKHHDEKVVQSEFFLLASSEDLISYSLCTQPASELFTLQMQSHPSDHTPLSVPLALQRQNSEWKLLCCWSRSWRFTRYRACVRTGWSRGTLRWHGGNHAHTFKQPVDLVEEKHLWGIWHLQGAHSIWSLEHAKVQK